MILTIIVLIIYSIIFLIGAIGNCIVLLIIYYEKKPRKSTNIFIMNLAFADLIFIITCIPESGANLFDYTLIPLSLCKYQMFFTYISIFASAYTLVLLALDRLVAVVYPLRAVSIRTHKNSTFACIFIWIISFLMFTLTLVASRRYDNEVKENKGNKTIHCFDVNKIFLLTEAKLNIPQLYFSFNILSYIIPLLAIITMYTIILNFLRKINNKELKTAVNKQWRRKITKTIWLVIATFAICWFPQNIRLFYIGLTYPNNYVIKENLSRVHYIVLTVISQIMSYFNYCINPILYCLMLKKYRWYLNRSIICIRSYFSRQSPEVKGEKKLSIMKPYRSSLDISRKNSSKSLKSINPVNV
uniref:G_PROTEIN_RECEP_F1_2 domain-containing protein n=1 Tax=Parastrongyloides trichosuri TaxID=131310 RepID=A0A0N4ZM37_PARTI